MYLITVCACFICFHVCNYLLKKKIKVIGVDSLNKYYSINFKRDRLNTLKKNKNFKFYKIDISKKKDIENLFKKYKFHYIFHIAAQPGVMYSYKNPSSYKKNNIDATKIVVDLIEKYKTKQFIFVSSSSVYGDQKKYPIKENFLLKPINYYAKTKIVCENLVQKKLSGLDISTKIVRPFTVYGPYGRPDMLILKLLSKINKNENIEIFDHGNQIRDFTYVDDIAKMIFRLSKKKNKSVKIFNLCASNPVSINQVVQIVKNKLKKDFKISYKKKRKGEMKKTFGSNNKVKKYINFKKFTNIKKGIDESIEWFLNYSKKKNIY